MARWWRVGVCPLVAALILAGLLANLAAPGTASEAEAIVICREPALPIPDADDSGVVDTITFDDDLTVVSATVSAVVSHGWLGDLVVTLSKVGDGPPVTLVDRLGVWDGDNDGCMAHSLDARFADGAPLAAAESCTSGEITGSLRPALPLALLVGRPLRGSWQLKVVDRVQAISGTLVSWCLEAVAAPAPRLSVTPAAVGGWVAPGVTRTETVVLGNQGLAEWRWGEAPVAAGGELLLVEGFEGQSMPPAGWQRTSRLPSATWQLSAGTGHGGTQVAMVPWADEPQDEWLISPPLSLQRGWLTMWTRGSASSCRNQTRCDLETYVMGPGIGTVLLGKADDDWLADGSWTAHAWELTPHLPATGSVRIGIRYISDGGSFVYIDDVSVSGLARPIACDEATAPWLAAIPPAAPAPPGGQTALTLLFDARTLPAGSYSTVLCIAGNDPLAPLWPLPVTLNVDGCAEITPPAPELDIEQGVEGSAVLSWTAEAGQAAYRLYRGSRPYEEMLWRELPAGAQTAVDPAPGSAAFYRLEAGNCSGDFWVGSERVGWLVFGLHRE